MKKKRLIIVTVCVLLAVLMIGSLFVAAGVAFANADDFKFGGLVGELLADKNTPTTDEPTSEQVSTASDWEEVMTNETPTEDSTYEDSTDTTEPPTPGGTPALRFFLGSGAAWISNNKIANFFEPGKASEWNHHAVIDDYNAEYITIGGWAAIFTETPMQLGYQIDDGQPVYGHYSGFREADQTTTTAALGMGAIRAADILLDIPVQNLSGTHTVNILVRNQRGNDEGVICTFTIEKAEPPSPPVFLFDPYALDQSNLWQTFNTVSYISEDGAFITIAALEGMDYSWFDLWKPQYEAYTNVHYIVIAYRSDYANSPGRLWVGSSSIGPSGHNHSVQIDYVCDGAWHTYVLDLSEVESVNNEFDLGHLRYNIFRNPEKADQSIDIAYIAGFESMEDVIAFRAQNNLG